VGHLTKRQNTGLGTGIAAVSLVGGTIVTATGGIGPTASATLFSQFAVAALTASANLFLLPAGGIIEWLKLKHATNFTGPGITGVTASIGVAGDVARYMGPFDVFQPVGASIFQMSNGPWSESQAVATQVIMTLTSTGANLNALTQGSLQVWAQLASAL
jgi:hypothetical protein